MAATSTSSLFSPKKDTLVDGFFDCFRETIIPFEGPLTWCIVIICWIYYGVSYQLARWRWKTWGGITCLPLVVTSKRPTEAKAVDTLYKEIIQELSSSDSRGWVPSIRQNEKLRRIVSQFMQHPASAVAYPVLHQKLQSIWSDLLTLPPLRTANKENSTSDASSLSISLILPAYGERGSNLIQCLQHAWDACTNPETTIAQVIVVNAGRCTDLEILKDESIWKDKLKVVSCPGGGRGPAMNYGAAHCSSIRETTTSTMILTFLHADTYLPQDWDGQIKTAFLPDNAGAGVVITQACAFRFGHHYPKHRGKPNIPGLRAVRWLGNRRAYDSAMPYGDHVISIPASYFHYLGGFPPNEPIMEDYNWMDYLRKRAAVLPNEHIRILPGTARCSVRRWEKLGVIYVTLVNALIVHRYSRGDWTCQDVFHYYYHRTPNEEKKNA